MTDARKPAPEPEDYAVHRARQRGGSAERVGNAEPYRAYPRRGGSSEETAMYLIDPSRLRIGGAA